MGQLAHLRQLSDMYNMDGLCVSDKRLTGHVKMHTITLEARVNDVQEVVCLRNDIT